VYAQIIESGTMPERIDELALAIRRELVTALREQHGFSGLLSLLDRKTGRGLLVVLWETDDELARTLEDCGAPMLTALAALAEILCGDSGPPTVWEVAARG
jgi:hypothetical protein